MDVYGLAPTSNCPAFPIASADHNFDEIRSICEPLSCTVTGDYTRRSSSKVEDRLGHYTKMAVLPGFSTVLTATACDTCPSRPMRCPGSFEAHVCIPETF
eukprot:jgi/Ulvmu1/3134/UM015_0174.1